jgi:sulfoxide reductase heme-binding subunit YedZ
MISKWKITWLALAALLLAAAAEFLLQGLTEEYIRSQLRVTARVSLVLFLFAFSASSLESLFQNSFTGWIRSNRRYLGVSFAASHGVHLLFIFALAAWFPHPFLDQLNAVAIIGGGLGYSFILAMAITSFPAPRKWLGERRWKLLHTIGSYYLWLLFAQSYIPLALEKPAFAPVAAAILAVLMLRIIAAARPMQRGA